MSEVQQKHEYINIHADIVCAVLIRIDKIGFHRRYDFVSLYAGDLSMCNSWSSAVDWSEVFNGFCRNALSKNDQYTIGNNVIFDFCVDDGLPTFNMYLKSQYHNPKKYSFSKLECLQIYSKMSKILSKCDLVAQGGY